MAHQRRSPYQRTHQSTTAPSPLTRKTYPLRRVHSRSSSHAFTPLSSESSPVPQRPVLVPLHNLRRLPSRGLLADSTDKESRMRDPAHPVQIGVKRKRVASSNENAHNNGRSTRRAQKRKRSETSVARRYASTSEDSESEASEMELDAPTRRWSNHSDSEEEQEADDNGHDDDEDANEYDEETDDTDDYLLHSAPHSQLNRLKKGDLVRLYRQAALPEDPELLTKAEIIQVIIDARAEDEAASLPPSSPPGRTDASSDYSSDEGHVAGDEDEEELPEATPRPGSSLRRRATMHELAKSPARPLKGRSLSMGTVLHANNPAHQNDHPPVLKRKASLRINTDTTARITNRSSPSTSTSQSATSLTAPGHRLRSRKISAPTPVGLPTPTSAASSKKGKGKTKQVEFIDEVVEVKRTSSRRHSKDKERVQEREGVVLGDESDLTELDELERPIPQPSPRRLRSKDRTISRDSLDGDATPTKKKHNGRNARPSDEHQGVSTGQLRKTPARKAKRKIKSLRESDLEMGGQDEVDELEDDEGEEEEASDDTNEETEVDELVSTGTVTPPPSNRARRTPVRQRLRRRNGVSNNREEENEGDEEHEEEAEDVDEDEDDAEDAEEAEDDEETIAVEEPRRLRNGKIVGDEDVQMDEDSEDAVEDELAEDAEESQEEEEDEAMDEEADDGEATDDDVDLTVATIKTLTRLRKDDLVRLCESRNLEPVGNKNKLAEALLQWRDNQANGFSSPSSTGTVRPPSTTRRGRKKRSSASTVPVLLRSQGVHTDEPRTPVPEKEKDEPELELDLESLGLEDREIPPEKIQKLEKIGSGGFKDVFIGKFKGRRIAISEFRGTLSAMDIKELKLLGGFDHPNIVRFLGVSIPENTRDTPVMIVSELCSNGDLFDYIRNVSAPSLHKVLRMMLDIASGLEYLHTRTPSVIHRDCKSSNILITAKGIAKIADFGLAKVKESTRSMVRSLVGTVNWQAPELWTAHPCYNHKVDVFSCAMVFWEMLQWHVPNKKFPWEGMNEHAIYDVVGAKKQRPSIAGLRKQWCPEIVDLMEKMWAQDPRDRPTMTEVMNRLRELVAEY